MRFRPLGQWVLVRRQAAKETKEGDIIIPEIANAATVANIGTVVAVGEGKRVSGKETMKPRVMVSDEVMFSGGGANEVNIDGERLLIMPEESILGIFGEKGHG